jgi:hypothetical protein
MAIRRASILCTVLFVSVMIFVASQAWAVVVDMTVKDTAGAVPDMEITFTPEDQTLPTTTGRTDTQGKVVDRDGKAVVLPPGKYGVRARGRDHVTSTETFTVGPGETASFSMTVERIIPWMVQSPPCSLCFGVGAGYFGQWADDPKLQPGEITIINVPGFDPIIERDGSVVNRFNWNLNAGVAHFPIGISTIHAGNWRFYPALNVQAGGGDLTINSERRSDGLKLLSLQGSGGIAGAGVGVIATCPNCSWYLGLTYDYLALFDAELEGDLHIALDPSITNFSTRAWVNSHSHSISGRFGLNLPNNRISPYLGIRGIWQDIDFKQLTQFDDAGVGHVTIDTTAKFTRDTVEGIAGVDAHISGPLFARTETTFNGSDVSVMFKLIYGIGFVDPYLSPGPRHAPN